jgi:uncharacterized protein (TIGR03437 family)
MIGRLLAFSTATLCVALAASPPGLRIDAKANVHPISPDIYGVNDYDEAGLSAELHGGVRRWGGDHTTRYHWQLDSWNSASDWYFESYPKSSANALTLPDSSWVNSAVETARTQNAKAIATAPMIGWLPKSRDPGCSYRVDKYGPQEKTNMLDGFLCGKGVRTDGTAITNDPNDVSQPVDNSLAREWVQYLVSRYDTAPRGGVAYYGLDNESMIWHEVHPDVHPVPTTYDEIFTKGRDYASAIKAIDPDAKVLGPDSTTWRALFTSGLDWQNGWSTPPYEWDSNPVDQMAHGGIPFTDWYLQQMRNYEQTAGTRLLDYLDLHGYLLPAGIAFGTAGDAANQALRLQSTRILWDPDYSFPDSEIDAPVNLIPRMRDWVAKNYPGTKLAITEYNWGALEDINGALAQADVLGIFGREGLDLASIWGAPTPSQPAAFAFRLYRNYDGIGGSFGETSVSAQSDDPDTLSIFAAQRSDQALTVVVINKTGGDLSQDISLANFSPASAAQVWRYSPSNLSAIVRDNDAVVNGAGIVATFPANSITLLVVPSAGSGVQPKVTAVVSAASYSSQIAPGTIVAVFGTGLAPSSIVSGTISPALMVGTSAGDTRVLFDGVPAPVLWARQDVVAAVVPYYCALKSSTHVQVEYQGRRSDPFEAAVSTVAPGLFTSNAQGFGNVAALNADQSVNTPLNPATAGSVVALFATGEGITEVPGVDGRVSTTILPKPQAAVSVQIGGKPADIRYAGAAPYAVAGALQVNAVVPDGVGPGAVPVVLTIGGQAGSSGVTISVR